MRTFVNESAQLGVLDNVLTVLNLYKRQWKLCDMNTLHLTNDL